MAGFLDKMQAQVNASPRMLQERRYANARNDLLVVILFSLINIFMLLTNAGSYFLFSAFVPYYIADMGMILCGMYPPEAYVEAGLEDMVFLDSFAIVGFAIVAIAITAIYFVAWLLSGKHRVGWLILALVLFSIDTLFLVALAGFADIVDIAFHVIVIVILAMGIKAHYRLKTLPPEEELVFAPTQEAGEPAAAPIYVEAEQPVAEATTAAVPEAAEQAAAADADAAEIQG